MICLYCHANNFNLDRFREEVLDDRWSEQHPSFLSDFRRVIEERLISVDDFRDLAEKEFDSDEALYAHLRDIYETVT